MASASEWYLPKTKSLLLTPAAKLICFWPMENKPMENRIQLNANLRFAPSGELTSRDLLINFREQDLDRCCELVADFSKRFNLNIGLAPNQLPQPQAMQV